MGANGKPIPAWGLHRRTVCFAGHNFEFDFLLAAVATPVLDMDAFKNPSQAAGPARGLGPHIH